MSAFVQFYDFFMLRRNGLKAENIKVQESEVEQVKKDHH